MTRESPVLDTQSLTIAVSANISVRNTYGQAGTIVTFPVPVAADNVPGVTATCDPPSRTFFPIGTTTVTCTATDLAGNVTPAQFTVTVEWSMQDLIDQLNGNTITLVTNVTTEWALLTTLTKVQQYVNTGNSFMAYMTMLQYVLQVDQAQDARRITPAVAGQLLTQTQALVHSIM